MSAFPTTPIHSSDWTPFKNQPHIIKSAWNRSFWNRKQVRIRIETSGELSIQVITQPIFARIASTVLKFLSRGKIKSFGKKVVSFTQPGYSLPKLEIPLSEKKEKAVFDLQIGNLALTFLPSYQRLNELGTALCDYALQYSSDSQVMEKVLALHLEIVNLQLSLTQDFQSDVSPVELYKKIQTFETQSQIACERYPLLLKECIETPKKTKETGEFTQNESLATSPDSIELEERLIDPLASRESEKIDHPPIQTRPSEVTSSPKHIYSQLLSDVQSEIQDLKDRGQLTSAAWLHNEMETIVAIQNVKGEETHALTEAIESLENALDSVEKNVSFISQLADLPADSPLETTLKRYTIQEIQESLVHFRTQLNEQEKKLFSFLTKNPKNPWLLALKAFFTEAHSKALSLADFHDSFESWIPGLQTGRHYLNNWLGNHDPLKRLSTLDRYDLVKHHDSVQKFCQHTLAFLQKETHLEKIFELQQAYDKSIAQVEEESVNLLKQGQYLHLAHLQKTQKTQTALVAKAFSSISSSRQAFQYAQTLQAAQTTFAEVIHHIHETGEISPIKQLVELKKLGSPHYFTLHQLMVKNGQTQLSAYIFILNRYQKMLNQVIPILKEQQNESWEQLTHLSSRISLKITEATSLTTNDVVRSHVWQIFSSPVPLNDLSPAQLQSYLEKIMEISQHGISEITEDAAKAGFKFN